MDACLVTTVKLHEMVVVQPSAADLICPFHERNTVELLIVSSDCLKIEEQNIRDTYANRHIWCGSIEVWLISTTNSASISTWWEYYGIASMIITV